MKVGFFDSGLGGLTIFKEAIKKVKTNYIYLGDNKNTPYGIKEKEEVKKYIFENVDFLVNEGCSIIVIACNTATSIAIKELRQKYPNICIIGTEPAVKKAIDNYAKKRILVCATSITAKEGKLKDLIGKLNAENVVDMVSLDKLVEFAESKEINLFDENINKDVVEYLKESMGKYNFLEYSHVVLGCTHFPLFKKEFRHILGDELDIIDGSIGVVKNLENKFNMLKNEEKQVSNQNGLDIKLVNTKSSDVFIKKFKQITGLDDFEVVIKY